MDEIAASIGTVRQTIWAWMQLSPEFRDFVARARELQGHSKADVASGCAWLASRYSAVFCYYNPRHELARTGVDA